MILRVDIFTNRSFSSNISIIRKSFRVQQKTTIFFDVNLKCEHIPIGSMGLVYLPSHFTVKSYGFHGLVNIPNSSQKEHLGFKEEILSGSNTPNGSQYVHLFLTTQHLAASIFYSYFMHHRPNTSGQIGMIFDEAQVKAIF